MRHFIVVLWVILAAAFLSCHKSAGSTTLSGPYEEISPTDGATALNFVDAGTVIVSGSAFFLSPLSGPDTLSYYLSSGSAGSLISFVMIDHGEKDTLTCNYAVLGNAELDLSFKPCPAGVPCYALGGMEFLFKK
jgi:hypothetical protein